jgi:hypothetical protein
MKLLNKEPSPMECGTFSVDLDWRWMRELKRMKIKGSV